MEPHLTKSYGHNNNAKHIQTDTCLSKTIYKIRDNNVPVTKIDNDFSEASELEHLRQTNNKQLKNKKKEYKITKKERKQV